MQPSHYQALVGLRQFDQPMYLCVQMYWNASTDASGAGMPETTVTTTKYGFDPEYVFNPEQMPKIIETPGCILQCIHYS